MTIPERTPIAVDHGLNVKRIEALLELFRTGKTTAHFQTLKSLRQRELVTTDDQLTFKGLPIAQELHKLDTVGDQMGAAEEVTPEEDEMVEIPAIPGETEYFHYDPEQLKPEEAFTCPGEAEQIAAEMNAAINEIAPITAAFQVLCRGRRTGEHSQLIAVVVGSESDAQRVADQWNLAHLADIAARSDATFAVAVPAEVGVYLFERFAVVEHS